MAQQKIGGWSKEEKATPEIQQMCDQAKPAILQKAGKNEVELFKALEYKSQLVEGMNYVVKIQVTAGGECWHVELFEPLPCYRPKDYKHAEVVSVKTNKTEADEITPS